MKDTAENAAQKIQAKAESVGFKNVGSDISVGFHRKSSTSSQPGEDGQFNGVASPTGKVVPGTAGRVGSVGPLDPNLGGEMHMPMEIARLLMSLLHAWGLDPDLDKVRILFLRNSKLLVSNYLLQKVCEAKLGLLRPLRPVCFGQISKGGHMSLLLPTYLSQLDKINNVPEAPAPVPPQHQAVSRTKSDRHVKIVSNLPSDVQIDEKMAQRFTSKLHWEFSSALTTNHLVSLLAMANTMITMSGGTSFVSSSNFAETNRRRLIRKLSRQGSASG